MGGTRGVIIPLPESQAPDNEAISTSNFATPLLPDPNGANGNDDPTPLGFRRTPIGLEFYSSDAHLQPNNHVFVNDYFEEEESSHQHSYQRRQNSIADYGISASDFAGQTTLEGHRLPEVHGIPIDDPRYWHQNMPDGAEPPPEFLGHNPQPRAGNAQKHRHDKEQRLVGRGRPNRRQRNIRAQHVHPSTERFQNGNPEVFAELRVVPRAMRGSNEAHRNEAPNNGYGGPRPRDIPPRHSSFRYDNQDPLLYGAPHRDFPFSIQYVHPPDVLRRYHGPPGFGHGNANTSAYDAAYPPLPLDSAYEHDEYQSQDDPALRLANAHANAKPGDSGEVVFTKADGTCTRHVATYKGIGEEEYRAGWDNVGADSTEYEEPGPNISRARDKDLVGPWGRISSLKGRRNISPPNGYRYARPSADRESHSRSRSRSHSPEHRHRQRSSHSNDQGRSRNIRRRSYSRSSNDALDRSQVRNHTRNSRNRSRSRSRSRSCTPEEDHGPDERQQSRSQSRSRAPNALRLPGPDLAQDLNQRRNGPSPPPEFRPQATPSADQAQQNRRRSISSTTPDFLLQPRPSPTEHKRQYQRRGSDSGSSGNPRLAYRHLIEELDRQQRRRSRRRSRSRSRHSSRAAGETAQEEQPSTSNQGPYHKSPCDQDEGNDASRLQAPGLDPPQKFESASESEGEDGGKAQARVISGMPTGWSK
jgi:hypothetical protein